MQNFQKFNTKIIKKVVFFIKMPLMTWVFYGKKNNSAFSTFF